MGDNLFEMTVRALDGQPVAIAGGFTLTSDAARFENLALIAFNIPLFETSALEITKSADKQFAEIGDVITYRVEARNATASPMIDATLRDELPASFHYVAGTARVEISGRPARSIEPEARGNNLSFALGTLEAGGRATVTYRVRVGANASEGEHLNTAIASGVRPDGEPVTTEPARASVRVRAGIFSMRQIIIGRVFEDANRNGMFDNGERPVVGARVYLNNGQSVVTDSAGQYNIPSIGEGSIVVSLDPVTVPENYLLFDEGRRAARSWTRLLRTPLGGGTLLRQNFALIPASGQSDNAHARRDNSSPARSTENSDASATNSNANVTNSTAQRSNVTNPAAQSVSSPARREETISALSNSASSSETRRAPGTYETEATETIAPVAAGEVVALSPATDEVIMSPALTVRARVAEGWTLQLEINGEQVSAAQIGEARVDHRNRVATFDFVGINLRPGPNRVRLTAIGAQGERGRTVEMNVFGRGPAVRLEIVPERTEVQAGGRDFTTVRVRAFDAWNHPAADAQVAIETSAGRLLAASNPRGANDTLANHGDDERDAGGSNNANGSSVTASDEANGANVSASELRRREREARAIRGGAAEIVGAGANGESAGARQQTVSLANGEAVVRLFGESTAEAAEIRAATGQAETNSRVRFTPEMRPTLMVGLAEFSFGNAAPDISMRGDDENMRGRLAFYYRGSLLGSRNLLTLAYDSQRPLNRTAGRDRLFQLDPLERAYPLFGDSSVRFEDAESNSKLYARLDRGRSFAMFGDIEANMDELNLGGYTRRLTGVKFHFENADGDFISVTGARPDTAFARDIIPGGSLSLVRLSHGDILPGSETVTLEVRDRRNPEAIIERETLVRSIDYNLNPTTGELFFLRPISAFDYELNLIQAVVTYEYRGAGGSYGAYTARGVRRFENLGLRVGGSFVHQSQDEAGAFRLGGLDLEQRLPGGGRLTVEAAMSRGRFVGTGGALDLASGAFLGTNISENEPRDGMAIRADLEQPLPFYHSTLRAGFMRSSGRFYNPFGATVAPGAQRMSVELDVRPRASRLFRFGFMDERNRTENVSNSRRTYSLLWQETWRENLRTTFGFDHRRYADDLSGRDTASNLITAGIEYRPVDRLELSVTREQNLTDADPTYPDQTTIAANYEVSDGTRLFFTQRLASAPITPISDISGTGFAQTGARRETAIGVETRFGRGTALNGRYQLENGINGTDSFAVIGLQNRLPLNQQLALEFGFERGFHLAGDGESFNSVTVGAQWTPTPDFRSAVRYELRDRNGAGQLFTIGAAGRLGENTTTMARVQWARGRFNERENSSMNATAALAFRPLDTDRFAVLFSYNHRSLLQDGAEINGIRQAATRDRADTLSSDALWQASRDLELYGRFALRFGANGDGLHEYASALTYLAQLRAQQRIGSRFDLAGETRWLMQPSSFTRRTSYGAEMGFWPMPDLRFGLGYNFTSAAEPNGVMMFGNRSYRRGFYFTISTKLSSLFDLFGTSPQGLALTSESNEQSVPSSAPPQNDGGEPR